MLSKPGRRRRRPITKGRNMSDPIQLVNPRIGTAGGGNCLVGPYTPLGLVRVGPDNYFPQSTSGYKPSQPVLGFSHLHLHGNGGTGRYGNIRLTPFCGPAQSRPLPPLLFAPVRYRHEAIPEDEVARVGYYAATLSGLGVRAN